MFTIRVYGICIENGKALLSDEIIQGSYVTKFPGGGLEFGEGTIDCLIREMREECGQPIEVLDHFYTTDFFQPSAFDPEKQVLSIYYLFRFTGPVQFPVHDQPFDFAEEKDDVQSFRWISLGELNPDDLTLPIDKRVGELLIERFVKQA